MPLANMPFQASNALARLLLGAASPWIDQTPPPPPAPAPAPAAARSSSPEMDELRRELDELKRSMKKPRRRG